MKIYTGYGDKGNTALYGGEKVSKHHLRIHVYGTLDELSSTIGLLRSRQEDEPVDDILHQIQSALFNISAEIATPDEKKIKQKLEEKQIRSIELTIDEIDEKLPVLKNFILPGGSEAASLAHIARTVCRRAERHLVELMQTEEIRLTVLVYINRLSDLFFVLARYLNMINNVDDVKWIS